MTGLEGVRAVLCPYDFSAACQASLREAALLARMLGAELHVVHVVITPPMVVLTPSEGIPMPPVDQTEFMKSVEARRGPEIQAELARAGAAGVSTKIAFRDALHADVAILDYAAAAGVGLIVMAKHAKAALSRFLLGSTTERVLRQAHCPVLVIPASDPRKPA
jgi:nucleotide-binding universal stress UspA family protein